MADGPHELISLPLELRKDIYELVLVVKEDIRVLATGDTSVRSNLTRPPYQQPSIMRVSRQIREETLPIYYGQNVFHFELQLSIPLVDESQDFTRYPEHFAANSEMLKVVKLSCGSLCAHGGHFCLDFREGFGAQDRIVAYAFGVGTAGEGCPYRGLEQYTRGSLDDIMEGQKQRSNTRTQMATIHCLAFKLLTPEFRWAEFNYILDS
ncbi:hypothetical protein BAUCODRAFT_146031 [Baudoinia panamericana UAMH 10762]|uniref:F-box domain-containing protein n=1 Tax=Baudoinia panamericana (strain UAMH 10762) TaxID=717646 RepID=M2MQI4_BAUPA|nr:uncharacterized protein BAUCODRAFT_146031 [Baudoinia panamericana UAMH 10762]EMC99046.1 hypothetical protein BAUCODRAFT_146031 [Baudoinia panamericana UAMH 10762]